MTTEVVPAQADTLISEAAYLMRAGRFRHLPVVGADGAVLGIVSERDLLGPLAAPAGDTQTLATLLSDEAMVVSPSTDIGEALSVLLEERFGAVPVVENGKLVGILTETDCLTLLQDLLSTHDLEI